MSSSDDDASEAWGASGRPPLRFGCFRASFWKRRKQLPSSSMAEVAAAASEASGTIGREGTDQEELTATSDTIDGELLRAGSLSWQEIPLQLNYPSIPEAMKNNTTDGRRLCARPLSWEEIPLAVDHIVLGYLPSFYDRCRLRCVCRRWRDSTNCVNPPPPRPLPMAVNADFTLLNCFADGVLTTAHRIKSPTDTTPMRTACIGSFDDWIVCAYPREWDARRSLLLSDQRCFILDPSKQMLVWLPNPPAFRINNGRIHGSVPVDNGNGLLSYTQPTSTLDITLSKVVLSTWPDMADCKVAALSDKRGQHLLTLCTATMPCWLHCSADFITALSDLEFFEGQLYIIDNADLYVLDFGPQFCWFPAISRVEKCLIEKPPVSNGIGIHSYSLVESKRDLLLVVRQFLELREQMSGVTVYILENRSRPWRWIETTTLDGNCILISSAYSKSYPARQYEAIEEDKIYFLDSMTPGFLPNESENFSYRMPVYNMRDKTISVHQIGSKPVYNATKFPMWFCPAH